MKAKILRNKNHSKSATKKISNILDLPNEILLRIVNDVSVYHRQKIRASCRRLKKICDGQAMHDFRKALNVREECEKISFQALRTIDALSEAYINAGLESVFAGTLISYVKKSYKKPFLWDHKTLKLFVRSFVTLADQQMPAQKGRLLYILTILNILKSFKTSSMLNVEEIPGRKLKMECELKGSWFSMHCMGSKCDDGYSYDKYELPVQLTDILIVANVNKPYKNLYESKKQLYYYGHQIGKNRTPRTTFTFVVYGPESILNIVKNPLGTDFRNLPVDDFDASIKLHTKGKIEFGFQRENVVELNSEDTSSEYILSSKLIKLE